MTLHDTRPSEVMRIRNVVEQHGKLAVDIESVTDDDDLYRAGLTSHASVNLMLALEDEFDIEFPEHMLRRQTFESVRAMLDAIEELAAELAPE
jgi:acyl carrier protein